MANCYCHDQADHPLYGTPAWCFIKQSYFWAIFTLTSYIRCPRHWQILLHIAVIALSLFALPVGLSENTVPPTDSQRRYLLAMLDAISGYRYYPYFVVSTTAPLIQKWFSQLGHHSSDDPYFLYVASNTGSLISLLSYPFLLEPSIGLANQQTDWSIGYGALCVLIAACAWFLWKSQQTNTVTTDTPVADELTWRQKLHWSALAFVPSSLLLGLTNFISTDIASVPLLWIIPLTVYLLSFIIVFSHWNDRIHPWMVKIQPFVLIPFLAYSFVNPADLPYWVYLILHVLAFFFAAMVCHGELAKSRPHTQHLTSFYLIMSFAGRWAACLIPLSRRLCLMVFMNTRS